MCIRDRNLTLPIIDPKGPETAGPVHHEEYRDKDEERPEEQNLADRIGPGQQFREAVRQRQDRTGAHQGGDTSQLIDRGKQWCRAQ